ncbi:hypothetical protein [Vibrio breoganii]|uniref:hypothetical protein n=1 Tax=Vibrio breoganii TaxID=553239 RepID=UPI000C82E3F4|nr:hypothetical protein [Vibrio breoganii]PMG98923.1 hypothetical protein BCU80_03205 [Vibrio breoganii]PMK34083.1 hypothetical protein BCU06_00370 [Vibrio breoganii]PML54572.1 hypothetical protein BCT73_15485 [Vibrio breoganii]PMO81354.1 hypothetical protein BCT00_11695 [Vibrio breoganii]
MEMKEQLVKAWADERLSGNLGTRDDRSLRESLLTELSGVIAAHYGDTNENAKALIDDALPSFVWEHAYSDIEIEVARALTLSLEGKKPFHKRVGISNKDKLQVIAACYAYSITGNAMAVGREFYSDKRNFLNAVRGHFSRLKDTDDEALRHIKIYFGSFDRMAGEPVYFGKNQLESWWSENRKKSLDKWLIRNTN